MVQIAGTSVFLNKLTKERLTVNQLNKACVYLRAKGVSFYDNWSKEHCLIVTNDPKQKSLIISAIQYSLTVTI